MATPPSQSAARSNEQANSDSTKELSKISIVDASTARPNPLFEYPDYTYSLSLHIIPPEKYNALVNGAPYTTTFNAPEGAGWDSQGRKTTATDPRVTPDPDNDIGLVLVASGGKRNSDDYARSPYFNEDFYFENLNMQTINGLNNKSKNSNMITVNFTLVEPYGVTFLDRLWLAAARVRAHSWSQIPYMLQIDFVGNTEAGKPLSLIKDQTKYIPIRIIHCKVKVTGKGAEYNIQAVPFGQTAFDESNASTPANFEVHAKTVKEFFSATGSVGEASGLFRVIKDLAERAEATKKEISEEEKKSTPNTARIQTLQKTNTEIDKAVKDSPYIVGSYTAAMNSYQTQMVNNHYQNYPETYAFDFHTDILTSEIVVPKKNPTSRTELIDPVKAIRAKAGITGLGINFKESSFGIPAGTSIVDVINLVMRSSKYVRDQITDPAEDPPDDPTSDTSNPLNWYRITSTVEISEFDMVRDTYSKKITYHIYPTALYNSKFPHAPQSQPREIVKQYDYIYTGKNDSIINFDINFDVMFFTTVSIDRNNAAQTVVQSKKTKKKPVNQSTDQNRIQFQNKQIKLVAGQADVPNPSMPDSKSVLVNDFYKSTLSSANGDMINLDLKIIGDPELIKQDDVFFNMKTNPYRGASQLMDPHNSVMFDNTDRYAKVTFKTPVDFDPATGRMITDTKYTTAAFSGIYKILIVDNNFQNGQFTQTMKLIRIFDNLEDPEGPNLAGGEIAIRAEASKTISEAKTPADQPPAAGAGRGFVNPANVNPEVDPRVAEAGNSRGSRRSAGGGRGFVNPATNSSAPNANTQQSVNDALKLKQSLANVKAAPINSGPNP